MTKIEVFNISQYSRASGSLSKRAKAEFAIIDSDINYKDIANKLKGLGYYDFTSPYIFTSISAKNKEGQQVFIYQHFMLGNDYIITSPTELLKELNN